MPRTYTRKKTYDEAQQAKTPPPKPMTYEQAMKNLEDSGVPTDRWRDLANRTFNGNLIKSQHIKNLLREQFKGFEFGLWNEHDLPEKLSDPGGAWEPLTTTIWKNVMEFNAIVAQRHGIRVKDGVLWFGNKAICYRPKDFDERLKKQRDIDNATRFKAVQRAGIDLVSERAHQQVEADLHITTERATGVPTPGPLDSGPEVP